MRFRRRLFGILGLVLILLLVLGEERKITELAGSARVDGGGAVWCGVEPFVAILGTCIFVFLWGDGEGNVLLELRRDGGD